MHEEVIDNILSNVIKNPYPLTLKPINDVIDDGLIPNYTLATTRSTGVATRNDSISVLG
jgi:hypothetical protein